MHTIHNIAFEVDINYDNSLVSWEQYYVDFFQERLMPRVERICDDWDKKYPNSKCAIDTIDINVEVNSLDLEVLQKEITKQISQQISNIRSDGSNTEGTLVATITQQKSPFEALVSYLTTGILPAHISVKAFKEWLGAVAEFTLIEKSELMSLFSVKTEAIERMLSLLRNDYEKLSTIINNKQQITAQYVTLETTFFQKLLKVLCAQFKLTYKAEEAAIWYKTLGFSSSLPQFSKTFLQLLQPKAAAESKRLTKIEETQLSVLVLQAITQYEQGKNLDVKASKIATIINIEASKSQKANTSITKSVHKNPTEETDVKATEKESNKVEVKASKNNKNKVAQTESEKSQTKLQQNGEVSEETLKNTETSKATTTKKSEEKTIQTNESNLAKANIKEYTETSSKTENLQENNVITRKSITKDIPLSTEKAGLILLHPFLVRFFGGVGILTEDNKINDIGKACMLLHFLATETEEVTDLELTLEKILLGIPLETVVNYQTPLTEEDKKLCEELLKAVLEHWVVLKKSTINTLRDMFLKREGELTITNDSIKLKINRVAQDVLLDKVPWNISLIRLKWMKKMMHIEW
ncbi:MAG: contractile injection system tape measure protein [Kordia sp.]|uniref:contractile injection system tape measure protein n=1 Tax=Kordia sp. TaxID=1965332 RepID=UPI00385F22E9